MVFRRTFLEDVSLIFLCSNPLGYYFAENVGGATIYTNFIIHRQGLFLKILLSSFGEEDFLPVLSTEVKCLQFYILRRSAKMFVGRVHYNFSKL